MERDHRRLALDGAVSSSIPAQVDRLPTDATHLVISVGGNDALRESGVLDDTAHSVGEVLIRLADIQDRFQTSYSLMLDALARRKLPTALCSIYDPRFADPVRRRIAALALSIINDVITRKAFCRQFTLIDLRIMFNEDGNFANPIEPSVNGGMKLARAVRRFASAQLQVIT